LQFGSLQGAPAARSPAARRRRTLRPRGKAPPRSGAGTRREVRCDVRNLFLNLRGGDDSKGSFRREAYI
jgi:hypothetical protein